MAKMWYDGTYLDYPNIKPIIFLLAAIILENEKDKFDKLLKNKLISNNISNQIGRAVYKMNNQKKVKNSYDDWFKNWMAEEKKSMANVAREEAIERKAKEIAEEIAKPMAEEMAKPMAKEMAKPIVEEMIRPMIEEKNNFILFLINQGYSIEEVALAGKISIDDVKDILNDKSSETKSK